MVDRTLAPVARSLVDGAAADARGLRAMAETDAGAALETARSHAAQILADARAEGVRLASRLAAQQLVGTRRAARQTVLEARRDVYEDLRRSAVDALVKMATAPEGRWLEARIAELARAPLGPAASVRRVGADGLTAVAELGARRATLGPEGLVDLVLGSMAAEVEGLWA